MLPSRGISSELHNIVRLNQGSSVCSNLLPQMKDFRSISESCSQVKVKCGTRWRGRFCHMNRIMDFVLDYIAKHGTEMVSI